MGLFDSCEVIYVPRSQNKKADALSKLAWVGFSHLAKEVRVQELQAPSTQDPKFNCIRFTMTSWMEELKSFLTEGKLPEDKSKDRKVQNQDLHYEVDNRILYQRSFFRPLLRCMDPEEAS
jgi:hypothetical protein